MIPYKNGRMLPGSRGLIILTLILSASLLPGCREGAGGTTTGILSPPVLAVASNAPGPGDDINIFRIDIISDSLVPLGGIRTGLRPSYISYSREKANIYAVCGADSITGLNLTSVLTMKYKADSYEIADPVCFKIPGSVPVDISADPGGDYLFISDWGNGSLSVIANDLNGFPEFETASLAYSSGGGSGSHPGMSIHPPLSNLLYLSDKGLGRIMVYRTIYTGKNIILREMSRILLPEGSSPDRFLADSTGTMLYVLDDQKYEITVIKRYLTGDYLEVQRVATVPGAGIISASGGDIVWSPDRRYIYTSNSGDSSISVFSLLQDGTLGFKETIYCEGGEPGDIAVSPDGKYMVVANRTPGRIVLFMINGDTGVPEYTGKYLEIDSPASVVFVSG